MKRNLLVLVVFCATGLSSQGEPGRRINLGKYSLQIDCVGKSSPTVVIETGFGDFGFDWFLVQKAVSKHLRVCTYDRAGYGSSDAVDIPRTFDQLNLELHALLQAAGERGPFLLVGHSFGGGVLRNYAERYPAEVAGLVLIDSVSERQALILGGKPRLLKEFANGKPIPEPTLEAVPLTSEKVSTHTPKVAEEISKLPEALQYLHARFASMPSLEAAEASQREWSSNYYAKWYEDPQKGLLGSKPLIVVTRASGGYERGKEYDVDQVEGQRLRAQAELLNLSSNSMQIVLPVGHNMHLEVPETIAWVINMAAARRR